MSTEKITPAELLEAAQNPLTTRTEEGTVVERQIYEQIAADKYAKTAQAAEAVPWGMRVARVQPGPAGGRS